MQICGLSILLLTPEKHAPNTADIIQLYGYCCQPLLIQQHIEI